VRKGEGVFTAWDRFRREERSHMLKIVDMIVARKKSQNEYETSHFGGACNNHATDENDCS
jgi:hypothetical protein